MSRVIRIGTRDSELALWQAKTVQKQLADLGYPSELLPVKSTGDLILDKPLYELGITGVFTKTLDVAMLKGEVDIAVHSMKDVPTLLPQGIVEAAVLKRANVNDVLIHKGTADFSEEATIATGSLRRQAQWLHKYPNHTVVDLRGNVNTRLQKLKDNNWQGAIFAAAGLERIGLTPEEVISLDWMIPAPAQGAMLVVAMENDTYCKEALGQLNDPITELCVHIERDFLRKLEGGCTAPIGALASVKNDKVYFEGVLFSLDGKKKLSISKSCNLNEAATVGANYAEELLQQGGDKLMQEIKAGLKKEK
ncbi:hydroxymethylbilane synthase [Aquimarina agarilytica]|uniref:hydroxymethylbilane synthase n=1 Tax=Aquimarina agarilytica TaxID=1087449 RepID=UPI00028A1B21|nr:hydroxymethylbilane synthase [Aquimarina agarilytica]